MQQEDVPVSHPATCPPDLERVSRFLLRAGYLILTCGGETSRVEETLQHMGRACSLEAVQVFCTPTGIMLAVERDGRLHTSLVTVDERGVNFEWLSAVSGLSHAMMRGEMAFEEAEQHLAALPARYPVPGFWAEGLAMAVAAATWGMVLGASYRELVPMLVAGMLVHVVRTWGGARQLPGFFTLYLATVVGALWSFTAASLFDGSRLQPMLVGMVLPLVPGTALTSAARDLIAGDYISGVVRAVEALLVGAAIVAGLQSMFSLVRIGGGL